MAGEVYRIDVTVGVDDKTAEPMTRTQRRVSKFEEQMKRLNRTRWGVFIHAVDRASGPINRIGRAAENLTRRTYRVTVGVVDMATRPIRAIARTLSSSLGLLGVGAGVAGGILWPLNVAGQLEQANIGFKTFLGSAEKAKQFMREIQQFGKDTPFETAGITEFATQLLPVFHGDTKMVFRTLRAFGDTAALTGVGIDRMSLALLGFRQIATGSTLRMQDLRQITENLLIPTEVIARELGISAKKMADVGEAGIPASKAIEAILRAMERPVSEGGFLGGMSTQMESLFGQSSMLRDGLIQGLVQPWGEGLKRTVLPMLMKANEWMSKNQETVQGWGQAMGRVAEEQGARFVAFVERQIRAFNELRQTLKWQQATPFQKFAMSWDLFVAKPFDQWWQSGGRQWAQGVGSKIGETLGEGLRGFIMAGLNLIDPKGASKENAFASAGATAGKAFMDGFIGALDFSSIASRAARAGGHLMTAPIRYPFGGASGLEALAGLGLGGWVAGKALRLGRGIGSVIKGGRSFLGWLRGGGGAAGAAGAAAAGAGAAEAASMAAAGGKVLYGPGGEILKTVGGAAAVGGGSRLAGWLAKATPRLGRAAPWLLRAAPWLGRGAAAAGGILSGPVGWGLLAASLLPSAIRMFQGAAQPVPTAALAGAGGMMFNVTVNVAPAPVSVTATADADSVIKVIRDHQRELADMLGDDIAQALEHAVQNMPRR